MDKAGNHTKQMALIIFFFVLDFLCDDVSPNLPMLLFSSSFSSIATVTVNVSFSTVEKKMLPLCEVKWKFDDVFN